MLPVRNFIFKDPMWRPKVVVTHNDVPEAGLKILREKCDVIICETNERLEILSKIQGADAILWGCHEELNVEALDAAGPQLKSVATLSVGMDYVDVEEVKRRKILLGYTPKVLNNAVADMGVGLAIAASRRFFEGRLKIENSQWVKTQQWMMGQDIEGSTVGIVGFGEIGQTIAKRLSGFEVGQFLYCGRNKKPEAEQRFNAKFVTFAELVEKSDFIFIVCPLTQETRKMFNSKIFSKMKPTSVLINIARGDIVDQEALIEALRNNKIFAAGLDVMTPEPLPSDHPIMSLPNCIVTPHIASSTVRTRDSMAILAAVNILAGLAGEPMTSPFY